MCDNSDWVIFLGEDMNYDHEACDMGMESYKVGTEPGKECRREKSKQSRGARKNKKRRTKYLQEA